MDSALFSWRMHVYSSNKNIRTPSMHYLTSDANSWKSVIHTDSEKSPQVWSPLWDDKQYGLQSPTGHALCNRRDRRRAETELSFKTLLPLTSFFASGPAHTDGWVSHCDLIRLAGLADTCRYRPRRGMFTPWQKDKGNRTLERQQISANCMQQDRNMQVTVCIPARWVIMLLTWNLICSIVIKSDLSVWNITCSSGWNRCNLQLTLRI